MKTIKRIRKVNLLFLFKTGIGSAIAILLAESFGLLYSPSAGIITLLTIQNTKKDTLKIAFKRFQAFVLAVIVAFLSFTAIGYTPIAFGAFVFLFVALCILFKLQDGIAMNAVLMTHFLIEKNMSFGLILNEVSILIVGMSLGIGLNLFMVNNKKRIKQEQLLLEEDLKTALSGLAQMLKEKDFYQSGEEAPKENINNGTYQDFDFLPIEKKLNGLLKRAYEEAGNTILTDTRYLVSYLEMRKLQVNVLKDIMCNIAGIPVALRQTYPVAEFIESIASSFHERNNAIGLLKELEELKEHFRQEELPVTREEFEYRATLLQILKELEYFLWLKRNFIKELEEKNMNSYWN
ncbi:MAG: aromatic acid exporter family protein [Mobilitalea sp.]